MIFILSFLVFWLTLRSVDMNTRLRQLEHRGEQQVDKYQGKWVTYERPEGWK